MSIEKAGLIWLAFLSRLIMKKACSDIYELKRKGHTEDAYEAARQLYSLSKSVDVSSVMFWTAVDVLKLRVSENRIEEAQRICYALERLLNRVSDEKGWMHNAMQKCYALIREGELRANQSKNGPIHMQMGIWGEDMAIDFLKKKGYTILERDWHSKHRDIDIIAKQGDCIVFVEVKTRRNKALVDPLMSINKEKVKNLRYAIFHYLHYRKVVDKPWRIDAITVIGMKGQKPEINHYQDITL